MERWNQPEDIVVAAVGGAVQAGGGGVEKVGMENLRTLKKKLGKKARMKMAMKRMCSGVDCVRFEGMYLKFDRANLVVKLCSCLEWAVPVLRKWSRSW